MPTSLLDRIKYWLSVGAQPSETVAMLLGRVRLRVSISKQAGILPPMPLHPYCESAVSKKKTEEGEGDGQAATSSQLFMYRIVCCTNMLEITGLTTCLGVVFASLNLQTRVDSNFASGFCFASDAECPLCVPSFPLSPAPL